MPAALARHSKQRFIYQTPCSNLQVSAMVYNPAANQLVTAGLDNQVRFACADQGRYSDQVVGVNSEPFSMVISADGYIVVACQQEVLMLFWLILCRFHAAYLVNIFHLAVTLHLAVYFSTLTSV